MFKNPWSLKTDEEILLAARNLGEYDAWTRHSIRSELGRRCHERFSHSILLAKSIARFLMMPCIWVLVLLYAISDWANTTLSFFLILGLVFWQLIRWLSRLLTAEWESNASMESRIILERQIGHLSDAIKGRHMAELEEQAAKLPRDELFDLLFLYERGFVYVEATGRSISYIVVKIINRVQRTFRVVAKPDTYFIASGSHQNMAVRKEHTFTLDPKAKHEFNIEVVCINADLAVPHLRDYFSGVARVSDEVARFLDAARDASPMAVQAGVWALTDGYTARQVQEHLFIKDGESKRPAVSDKDIEVARQILSRLAIPNNL